MGKAAELASPRVAQVKRIETTETIKRKAKQFMTHTTRDSSLALVVVGALLVTWALAAEKDSSQQLDPKKAEEACTPGAAHKALVPLVGDWYAEVKMWME